MPNLLCFCADPQDLRTGHNIVLFAPHGRGVPWGGSSELLSRAPNTACCFTGSRIPSPGFVSMPDQRRFKNRRITHL